MFDRFDENRTSSIKIEFDGTVIEALEGEMVASALMAAGIINFRDAPVSITPRGPYCMMGVCFECLVEIDGVGHQQACLVPVRGGMSIKREKSKRLVSDDLVC
jgi:sarcosine oxidase subunit alpha